MYEKSSHFHARAFITVSRHNGLFYDSGWFLISKSAEALDIPGLESITVQCDYHVGPRLWTDDRSDVFRLIY